jgi:YVTN family beta-propeller protein
MTRTALAATVALVALAACTANSEEVRPRERDIFFPTGAAISPDERWLFVTNANSELRYDSGSISVLDLIEVDTVIAGWLGSETVPAGCAPDTDRRETLVCNEGGDEGEPAPPFINGEAGVRIGNFASALAIQDKQTPDGQLRLIVAVRGDPSVTWADFTNEQLECGADTAFPLCDEDHRLAALADNPEGTIPDEPFQVAVDSDAGFALVTHLTTGSVTLVDSPAAAPPGITDIMSGLFGANQQNARGAAGVAGRPDGANPDLMYVTSRTDDRIQLLNVELDPRGAFLVQAGFFFLDAVGSNFGESADTRYAQFARGGERLLLVNRRPPSLQMYDTADDATGFPANRFVGATDLCREASNLAIADVGDGDKAFVTCFRDGEVYVIDTDPQPQVEWIVTVGRGPFGIAVSPSRQKLYVTNFLDDTIAVVELDPASELRYQVVLRIGVPRS